MKGRVVRVSGLRCLVELGDEQWQCDLRGRIKAGVRSTTSPVAVGDWVDVEPIPSGGGVIKSVYFRYSKFSRLASGERPYEQIVAVNLDQLVIVVSTRNPALRTGFIDRALVMALKGDMESVICFNKIDLDPEGVTRPTAQVYQNLGYRVCCTSAKTGEGIERFEEVLKEREAVVVGQSGVGKSSLLNRIDPGLSIKTRDLMQKHDRGRHTTATVQLYRLKEGGYVADTPGIKELQLWQIDRAELAGFFVEMEPLIGQCQFRNCIHLHEPECAVRRAVEQGEIAQIRYNGYRRIMETME